MPRTTKHDLLMQVISEIKEDTKKIHGIDIRIVKVEEHLKTLNGSVLRQEKDFVEHKKHDDKAFDKIDDKFKSFENKLIASVDKICKKIDKRVKPLETFKTKIIAYVSSITILGGIFVKYFDFIKDFIKNMF